MVLTTIYCSSYSTASASSPPHVAQLCKCKVYFPYFMLANFPTAKQAQKPTRENGHFENGGVRVRLKEFPLQQAGGSACSRKTQYETTNTVYNACRPPFALSLEFIGDCGAPRAHQHKALQ